MSELTIDKALCNNLNFSEFFDKSHGYIIAIVELLHVTRKNKE